VPSSSAVKQISGLLDEPQSFQMSGTNCPSTQRHTAPDLNPCQIHFEMFNVSEGNVFIVIGLLYFISV
jgi:hypothetical protein